MYTKIHNRKVHFKKIGSGDPVILLHGWGHNSYSLHQIAQKASRYFTVYSIDLPGFGKSDLPPRHWGLDRYTFMLKEFIKKYNLDKPVIVGHAFGGSIGIMLAAKEPKLLKSLIISNSPIHQKEPQTKISFVTKKIPRSYPVISQIYIFLRNLYYRIFEKNSDLPKFPKLEPNFRKIISQDFTHHLKKIKVPTLILWGEEDTCTPVLFAYEMKNKIPHAKIHTIPDGGHDVILTHSDSFWKEMKRFLLD